MTDIYYLDYSENFTGVYGTLSICTAEISPDDPSLTAHNCPEDRKGEGCCLTAALLLLLSRFSRVRLCATPEMAAHQAPPSLGFSRQEHWSGLPFPSPMHESEK